MRQRINFTVTGNLGADPHLTTTSTGSAMVILTLCVTLPPLAADGPDQPRWFKVVAFGTLAAHAAQSLHKGQLVTVSADDIRAETWTGQDGKSRAKVSLKAYDIAPSLVYDTAVSGYQARKAAAQPAAPEPVPAEEQANQQVLAGVTAGPA